MAWKDFCFGVVKKDAQALRMKKYMSRLTDGQLSAGWATWRHFCLASVEEAAKEEKGKMMEAFKGATMGDKVSNLCLTRYKDLLRQGLAAWGGFIGVTVGDQEMAAAKAVTRAKQLRLMYAFANEWHTRAHEAAGFMAWHHRCAVRGRRDAAFARVEYLAATVSKQVQTVALHHFFTVTTALAIQWRNDAMYVSPSLSLSVCRLFLCSP
jgi:hypothetical protein